MFAGNKPPDGWTIAHGCLEEETTVAGYMQRRCAVRGSCYQQDCRRNVHLDYTRMIKNGQGLLRMSEIQATLRCGRLGGCSITWAEEPSLVPTLGMFVGRENVAIQIRCLGRCKDGIHVTTVATLIARLQGAKTGGPETPIAKMASAIPGPCSGCGTTLWRVDLLWFDPSAGKTPLWKKDLDKRLAEAEFRRAQRPMAEAVATVTSRRARQGGRG